MRLLCVPIVLTGPPARVLEMGVVVWCSCWLGLASVAAVCMFVVAVGVCLPVAMIYRWLTGKTCAQAFGNTFLV